MVKEIKSNKKYKVRVEYGGKTTKTMELTGIQILDKRRRDEMYRKRSSRSSRYKPYVKITVLEEVK